MLRWLDWLWPRYRLEAGPAKWTRDRMGWLVGQFGWDRLRTCQVVLPTPKFFPDRYDQSEDAARALFLRTCGYMGIDPAQVELQFHYPIHRAGFTGALARQKLDWAGQFQTAAGKKIVRIDAALLPDPETLVATFAHELAHVVLLGEQRISPDDPDHELVTDLTTVFFGLGVFNANMAYRDTFVENQRGESVLRLGYLTPPIWSYALALFANLREERKPDWLRYLRTAVRSPSQQAIADLSGPDRAKLIVGGQLDCATRTALLLPQYPWLREDSTHGSLDQIDGADDGSAIDTADDAQDDRFSPDCTADDLFALGLTYSDQKDWDSAIIAFSAAILKSPSDGEAFQKRGWARFEQGRFQQAFDDGMSAVRLHPRSRIVPDPWCRSSAGGSIRSGDCRSDSLHRSREWLAKGRHTAVARLLFPWTCLQRAVQLEARRRRILPGHPFFRGLAGLQQVRAYEQAGENRSKHAPIALRPCGVRERSPSLEYQWQPATVAESARAQVSLNVGESQIPVHPSGLEPLTFGSVDRCSIQLS